ncbi:uncharacterized protein LOC114148577 isoform X2 [Xiphophorus couchianus]|uniref:uncharacterized protein LOC114148577 isoform X2 n=1 Tax=Xiphophorus couchianus TaxID=32473 RepID=UPI001015DAB8|nr:uncharacterized protein LOC114148577 isoform X2 [Xiphophorus couchianus]
MCGDFISKTSHRNLLLNRMCFHAVCNLAAPTLSVLGSEDDSQPDCSRLLRQRSICHGRNPSEGISLQLPGLVADILRFYHLMAWGVPLVMASLPLLKGYYGLAGAWCWITDDHVAWRFGIWYVPLFSLIFLMICCYARIICVANKRMQSWRGTFNPERERRKVSLAEEIKPLKWYPSVYLLVSTFPLVNRLHNAFYPEDPSFPLTLLHVLSAPLHGLANAFVFGLDKEWWSLLSPTGLQLALQSRLCDRTRIGEYYPGAVRYTQADLIDPSDDDDDDDTNVLFYSPDMTLKDRGP